MYLWLYMIGVERRKFVEHIEFVWEYGCPKEGYEMLGECERLKRLFIAVSPHTGFGTPHPQIDLWVAKGGLGLTDVMRGFKELDLRLREVRWGLSDGWFEGDRKPVIVEYNYVGANRNDRQPVYGSWFPKGHVEEFEEYLKGWIGKGNEVKEEENVMEEIMEESAIRKEGRKQKANKRSKKVLKKEIKKVKEVGSKEDKNVGMAVENAKGAATRYQNRKERTKLSSLS